jgi:hypothetical protein
VFFVAQKYEHFLTCVDWLSGAWENWPAAKTFVYHTKRQFRLVNSCGRPVVEICNSTSRCLIKLADNAIESCGHASIRASVLNMVLYIKYEKQKVFVGNVFFNGWR